MGNWNYSERLDLGWCVEKNLSEEVRVISKSDPEREELQSFLSGKVRAGKSTF